MLEHTTRGFDKKLLERENVSFVTEIGEEMCAWNKLHECVKTGSEKAASDYSKRYHTIHKIFTEFHSRHVSFHDFGTGRRG